MQPATVIEANFGDRLERKESLLKCLDELRARVESGEIIEVLGVMFSANHYQTFGVGNFGRHKTAGIMLDLAMERINRE